METTGRCANNFIVESLDAKTQISLPVLTECDMLPDDRTEILKSTEDSQCQCLQDQYAVEWIQLYPVQAT